MFSLFQAIIGAVLTVIVSGIDINVYNIRKINISISIM